MSVVSTEGGTRMFERLTLPARQVVVGAQEQARALGHDSIGTGHLLIALAGDPAGVATRALSALGASQETVRGLVLQITGVNPPTPDASLPFTPEARNVISGSLREALTLGHSHIGTGHLLLAMITENSGPGAEVLSQLGITDQLCQETRGLLLQDPASEGLPAPAPAATATPSAPSRGGFLRRSKN